MKTLTEELRQAVVELVGASVDAAWAGAGLAEDAALARKAEMLALARYNKVLGRVEELEQKTQVTTPHAEEPERVTTL